MAAIRLERLRKLYDAGVIAVHDVDLEVRDGEFMVLVGPSGCGKSTTLRMVAGLETPTSGRIFIGDEDVTEVPPRDRDVAMVFQSYALYPHMTVFDNLAFGLRMRRRPKAEIRERVHAVAATLGLQGLLQRRPGALSGGQRQRVALGRAIVRQPRAFLFDEPLSNLDAKLRVATRAELVKLHRRLRTTMLYVTHDQVEAMTMGERIAVLDRGRLQQLAAPLELYDRPATRFVAEFIGSPAMNLFCGELAAEDDRVLFRGAALRVALDRPPERTERGARAQGAGSHGTAGRRVELGVRAEHLAPCDPGTGDMDAVAQAVEPLGSETLLYCRNDAGEEFVARVEPGAAVPADTRIGVRLERRRLHLFDAETGTRITA